VTLLEPFSTTPLGGPHRAAPPQLGLVEAVDEVALPHDVIQIEGPVLAGFEGAEAIEDQGLGRRPARPEVLVEQQAVASQALDLALDGAVADPELAGDLAVPRTGERPEEESPQSGPLQPVGGREGL